MKLISSFVIVSPLLLTACQAIDDAMVRMEADAQAAAEARRQAQIDTMKSRCIGYGFTLGTEAFANCMQTETLAAERNAQEQAARMQVHGCTLYEHINYGGEAFYIPPGAAREVFGSFNDKASSVRVSPRCRLVAYEHVNFKGGSVAFDRDASTVGFQWNDKFSSAQCMCK